MREIVGPKMGYYQIEYGRPEEICEVEVHNSNEVSK